MHDPERIALEIAEKLASHDRHVIFLLGAGASCAAGLPTLAELKQSVQNGVSPDWAERFTSFSQDRNLEEVLTRLRLLSEALSGTDQVIDRFSAKDASDLDAEICRTVARAIRSASGPSEAHDAFAQWIAQSRYSRPIEVFTLNYDTLIEEGLERALVPYFDGFAGVHQGRFRPDLVDDPGGSPDLAPPPGWPRVWKLHGSVSWTLLTEGSRRTIVRQGASNSSEEEALAIYPSSQKYQESRRMPFVVLADRLRRSLAVPKSICIVSGFSFGDQHINEVLYEAAKLHPSSEILALFYSEIPEEARQRGLATPNLTLLGSKDAVLGGLHFEWKAPDQDSAFWSNDEFTLGDFTALAEFLRRASRPREQLVDVPETKDA